MSNKKVIRDFFKYGYNEHNYDKVREILANNYFDHSPAAARNPEDAIVVLRILENAFNEIEVKIHDLIEEGELIAGRFLFTGIHAGGYMDIKPSFHYVEWEFLENFRIQDGVISESWGYWPDLEIRNLLLSLQRSRV